MTWTILPEVTPPFSSQMQRVHAPTPWNMEDGWKAFRACLRWEFGFTCAICQLHEADIVPETTTVHGHTIEHYIARSSEFGDEHKDEYGNCYWVCKYCNEARGKKEVVDSASGGRLINPLTHVWSKHFVRVGDELQPKAGDADAAYTAETYKINHPQRTSLRHHRETRLSRASFDVERLWTAIEEQDRKLLAAKTAAERDTLLRERVSQAKHYEQDRETIRHFSGVPDEAPERCRCSADKATTPVVTSQWRTVVPPPLPPDPPVPRKRRFRL